MLEEVTRTIVEQGLVGALLVASVFGNVFQYKQSNILHKEMREILREIFPAVAVLEKALDAVQRRGDG